MLPGRLGQLRAIDVMTRDVVSLTENISIEIAVSQLKEAHITGAPVTSNDGKLVGILSLNDLVLLEEQADSKRGSPVALAPGADRTPWNLFQLAASINESVRDEQQKNETVGERMSTHVTSINELSTLIDVARIMCDGHWHRVPVVDAFGKLTGIISSMDLMAALVNVADEHG